MQQVIITDLTRKGDGKEFPIRVITEVYLTDGERIASEDPLTYPIEDVIRFTEWYMRHGKDMVLDYKAFDHWKSKQP